MTGVIAETGIQEMSTNLREIFSIFGEASTRPPAIEMHVYKQRFVRQKSLKPPFNDQLFRQAPSPNIVKIRRKSLDCRDRNPISHNFSIAFHRHWIFILPFLGQRGKHQDLLLFHQLPCPWSRREDLLGVTDIL